MKNIIKTKTLFGAGLTALAFSSILPSTAFAQSCAVVPTCDELGYNKTASDCSGLDALKCPFDNTKYFCSAAGSGSKCDNPNIGSILYSDMSCSSSLDTTKTPIGVIFNPTFRLAIALKTERKAWSIEYFDVPGLTNYTSEATAKADWAGKSNTNVVLNYCKSNSKSCPAFEYVSTYKTDGTNAGDWYLPALGEVNNIYENRAVLNRTLSLIGGTQLATDDYHWSSSEYDKYSAWSQILYGGRIYGSTKDPNFYVRPVLAF